MNAKELREVLADDLRNRIVPLDPRVLGATVEMVVIVQSMGEEVVARRDLYLA